MEDRNPSPPPEFDKDIDLYKADSVGGTAISKHWVLKTLMEIINVRSVMHLLNLKIGEIISSEFWVSHSQLSKTNTE